MQGLMGRLICRIYKYVAILIIKGNRTFRFQKCVFCPWCLEMMGNHIFGISDGLLSISPADMFVSTNIIFFLIKYLRSIWCSRLFYCVNVRKNLIFYLYQLPGLLCCFPVPGCHQGNGISKIMGQASNRDQCVLVMLQMANFIFSWNILCCDNCFHPWKSCCLRSING